MVGDLMYEVIPTQLPSEAVHECITLTNPDNPISLNEVETVISMVMNVLPENWLTEINSSDIVVSTQSDLQYAVHFQCGCDTIDGAVLTCKRASDLLRTLRNNTPKGEIYWKKTYVF